MIRNNWVLKLFIGACIVLLIAAIFRVLTPQQAALPEPDLLVQNADGTRSTFTNISFVGTPPEVPEALPVVEAQPDPALTQNAINQVAFNLGLAEHPDAPHILQSPDWLLTVSRLNNQATLTTMLAVPQGGSLNEGTALEAATIFVNTYLPDSGLQLVRDQVRYLSASDEIVEVQNIAQASIIEVPFTYLIEGIPVFYYYDSLFPITLFMDSNNEVNRANMSSYLGQIFPTQETIPTIPLDQALAQLNSNSTGSILTVTNNTTQNLDLRTILGGTMTEAQLEYRVDSQSQLAYPVYRLSGTLIDVQNIEFDAEIIVPAVNLR